MYSKHSVDLVRMHNKLDPLHYYTAAGLTWDALLKYTGIELVLLTDYDLHLFIEKEMRGGVSMTSKRHARANKPGVPSYDLNEQHNHIMYYDENNLYGWVKSQPLPYSGFKWVDITPAEQGEILEVDLEYPAELHDLHNDYPLAPERLNIKEKTNACLTTSQTYLKITACSIPTGWSRITETRINMFCTTEICSYTCP